MRPLEQIKDPNALSVLSAVRERDMEGGSLVSVTGLKLAELEAALKELLEKRLIAIRGATSGPRLNDSYIYVPLQAKGYVDVYLGRTLS